MTFSRRDALMRHIKRTAEKGCGPSGDGEAHLEAPKEATVVEVIPTPRKPPPTPRKASRTLLTQDAATLVPVRGIAGVDNPGFGISATERIGPLGKTCMSCHVTFPSRGALMWHIRDTAEQGCSAA